MRHLDIAATGTLGIASGAVAAWIPTLTQISQGLAIAGQLATVVIALVTLWKLFEK